MTLLTPLPNRCVRSGPLPIASESLSCDSCSRTVDRAQALRCRVHGPEGQTNPPTPELIAAPCCGQAPVISPPGLLAQSASYVTALAKFVGDGMQARSPAEQAECLSICRACPLLQADGSCVGCGCKAETKIQWRLEDCPAGKWFADLRPVRPLVNPVRNLIYHLLPAASNEMWKWNLDQLKQRWGVFNGRRYLSVVESFAGVINDLDSFGNGRDVTTVPYREVIEYCDQIGLTWTATRRVGNDPRLGEMVSFRWLIDAALNGHGDPSEITLYAHGKGTTHAQPHISHRWAAAMYHYCLDDIYSVERALERYPVAASLLRSDGMSHHGWHPSGTYWWVRNLELLARDWQTIQQSYHGAEAYIGDHFERHEVAALAHPEVDDLYQQGEWNKIQRASDMWDAARQPAKPASPPLDATATIVITCGPRYDRWVRDAIASALEQEGRPEIVCVFDRCDPIEGIDPRVKVVRVDHGAVQLARRAGIADTRGDVLFFLDADNAYDSETFVRDAVSQLVAASRSDPRVAGLSVDIQQYDHEWRKLSGSLTTPDIFDRGRFERSNYLDTACPVWRHVVEASWHVNVPNGSHEDHHAWRQLIRDGWTFAKGRGLKLKYRICPDSSTSVKSQGGYSHRYGFHREPITIFVPLSGRLWAWPGLRDWLESLARTERGQSVRLVLCDTSGREDYGDTIRREGTALPFADVRYYRQSVATPGLADLDRAKHERAVQLACARIYNRFAQECTTHLTLIIEDDILPQLSGEETLRALIDGMGENVAAVSGVYHDRRHGGVNAWTSASGTRVHHVTAEAMRASPSNYLEISGAGYGCLLIRREVLQSIPHALPPGELWYDPRFFNVVARSGLRVRLSRQVLCDHRNPPPVTPSGGPRTFSHDWFSSHIPTWEQHLLHLRGTPVQCLEVGSYEGRSSCWIADNLMSHPESRLTCVDAGIGVGHAGSLDRLRGNLATLPNRQQVSLLEGLSSAILPTLSGPCDFAYLDSSHLGGDVIRDLCNAWPLLVAGGILIVDDYQFEEQGVPPREWARPAIDYWLSLRGKEIEILHQGYQVIVRRAF